MLYLLDLPVAEDMDGEVFAEVFEDKFLKSQRVKSILTYGPREGYSEEPYQSRLDEVIVERLRSFGYLD